MSGENVVPPRAPHQGRYAYAATLAFSRVDARNLGGLAEWSRKYLHGALRLALSLRDVGSIFPFVVIAANLSSPRSQDLLRPLVHANVTVVHVPSISKPADFYGFKQGLHMANFNKLHVWNMTQYERIVHLDLDTVVIRNIDHLFSASVQTPAAIAEPSFGPLLLGLRGAIVKSRTLLPFNSGLLVLQPDPSLFSELMWALRLNRTEIGLHHSYNGGDQGFLYSFLWGRSRAAGPYFELPRRYNLQGCVQSDEVGGAYVLHMNHNFMDGLTSPIVTNLSHKLNRMTAAAIEAAFLAHPESGRAWWPNVRGA